MFSLHSPGSYDEEVPVPLWGGDRGRVPAVDNEQFSLDTF